MPKTKIDKSLNTCAFTLYWLEGYLQVCQCNAENYSLEQCGQPVQILSAPSVMMYPADQDHRTLGPRLRKTCRTLAFKYPYPLPFLQEPLA